MNSLESAPQPLHNFLNSVVLKNCIEYFRVEEQQAASSSNPERVRLFFNAVTAVDSALDYAFEAEAYSCGLDSFLEFLARTEPALRAVRRIARSLTRPGAVGSMSATRGEPTPETIQYLRSAFAFWLDYARSLEEEMSEREQRARFSSLSHDRGTLN